MNKEKNKNLLGQQISLKAHLAIRFVVIFFLVFALFFSLENHYQKSESSIFTLLIIVLLVITLAIETGKIIYSLWIILNDEKNT